MHPHIHASPYSCSALLANASLNLAKLLLGPKLSIGISSGFSSSPVGFCLAVAYAITVDDQICSLTSQRLLVSYHSRYAFIF